MAGKIIVTKKARPIVNKLHDEVASSAMDAGVPLDDKNALRAFLKDYKSKVDSGLIIRVEPASGGGKNSVIDVSADAPTKRERTIKKLNDDLKGGSYMPSHLFEEVPKDKKEEKPNPVQIYLGSKRKKRGRIDG